MYLDDLLDSQVALPAIPRNIAMVLSELSRDEPDLRKVSQYIHTDIGLTTLLLGLANSAQFQLKNRFGNVSDALAVLGLVQVRSLTAAAAMAGAFKHVRGLGVQQFWRYSLNVAKLPRKLARLGVANASIAFTAGLVHAAGELVMHLGMPDQMRWLNERVEPLDIRHAHAERHLLGYFYADVGAGFAKSWEFPQSIVDAIAHHFAPFDNEVYEPIAGVVHLTAWRARAREAELKPGELADRFPDGVALELGIDIDEVLQQEPIGWTTSQESASIV